MTRSFAVALCLAVAASALAATPATLKTTEFGRGPTIVFLHSMGGGRTSWLPTAKKLLGGHRVVMMDLPGHGDSPLPDPFSLEVAAEAVSQTLAAQKAESTVVVGQGVGGVLALMVASAHPERMRGIVLLDATLKTEVQIPDHQQRNFFEFVDANYDQFLRMIFLPMGRDSAQGVVLHAQAAQAPPATIKAYFRELLRVDVSKALKGLKPQLLVVNTEKRWPADKAWADIARQTGYEGVDSTAARRIPSSGPLVATEQPDSLATILRQFTAQALAKK